jgi:hypothetical protein
MLASDHNFSSKPAVNYIIFYMETSELLAAVAAVYFDTFADPRLTSGSSR